MFGYLAILGATLAGYAGAPPWTIAVAAIALSSLSYAEHQALYKRAQDMGHQSVLDTAMLRSVLNAILAASVGYGGGWLLRVVV